MYTFIENYKSSSGSAKSSSASNLSSSQEPLKCLLGPPELSRKPYTIFAGALPQKWYGIDHTCPVQVLRNESSKLSMDLGPPNLYDAEMWLSPGKTSGDGKKLVSSYTCRCKRPQNFLRQLRKCKI